MACSFLSPSNSPLYGNVPHTTVVMEAYHIPYHCMETNIPQFVQASSEGYLGFIFSFLLTFSNYEQSCYTFCVQVFRRTCFDSVEWGWTYLLFPFMMQLFNIKYKVGCRFFVDVIYLPGYRGSLIFLICWGFFFLIHE